MLWLHGEDDQLVPVEGSRAVVAHLRGTRSEQRTYPGGKHEIFNETNADEVLDDVTAFLASGVAAANPHLVGEPYADAARLEHPAGLANLPGSELRSLLATAHAGGLEVAGDGSVWTVDRGDAQGDRVTVSVLAAAR